MTHKDKELVIAALEEYKGDSTGLIAATIEDCQRVVRELPVKDGWIPVSERLPEYENHVLTYRGGSGISVERMFSGAMWDLDYDIIDSVTHWMPLPEPPREGAV